MTSEMSLIPFNRASMVGSELEYVADAVARGHISGDGYYSKRAEQLLAGIAGSPRVLLTTSCTHALELAARVLDIGPGDEVIVPAFTFVSTAAAIALTGATPVFVDVTDATLNLDVNAVREAMTSRTRGVFTVHYAGIAESIDQLRQLCIQNGLFLVEDNAHGLGAKFAGQPLGTFGVLSTLSFHETKNITCGEGGALAVNDEALLDRAEILREKGTNRARFFRGEVDKYTWVDIGSSWIASDMLAAFLTAQCEGFDVVQSNRMRIWNAYQSELETWAAKSGVRTPRLPEGSEHAAHMYFLRMIDLDQRTAFVAHMRAAGVLAVFHYQALNASPAGIAVGGRRGACPIAEDASDTLVRLPLFADMTPTELERVLAAVLSFEG